MKNILTLSLCVLLAAACGGPKPAPITEPFSASSIRAHNVSGSGDCQQ